MDIDPRIATYASWVQVNGVIRLIQSRGKVMTNIWRLNPIIYGRPSLLGQGSVCQCDKRGVYLTASEKRSQLSNLFVEIRIRAGRREIL
jgi:hypothetical protein